MTRRMKLEKLIKSLDMTNKRSAKTLADIEATLGRFAKGSMAYIIRAIRERS